MDFDLSDEQMEVRDLAARIFTERSTHERLKEVEAAAGPTGPFDRQLWSAIADAGLLGIALPEDVGGAGLDFVASCLVVEAAGLAAAAVPIVETLGYALPVIDRFGTDEQRRSWLPRIASGEVVPTAALVELVDGVVVEGTKNPATSAVRTQNGTLVLSGTKACVPAGLVADVLLVPATATTEDGESLGIVVCLVDPHAAGVTLTRQDGPARPEALVDLSGTEVPAASVLGGPAADGAAALEHMAQFATAALCVQEAGICAAAVKLIGEYTKAREQFEKPIATFQAVGQRAADAYVDAEAVRLTAWQAAWRLAAGLPPTAELAVAKFWAAEGGQRVVHAAVHLHGGVGVDRDYPLHRYFLLTEQIELTLGGVHSSLQRLGSLLAAEPA